MFKCALVTLIHLLAATHSAAELLPPGLNLSSNSVPPSTPSEPPSQIAKQVNQDACGPVVQPSASPSYQPSDTCRSPVAQSPSPATYGVCIDTNGAFTFSDPTGPIVPTTFTNDCTAALMSTVCGSLPARGAGAGQWVWAANGHCTIGYWMSADPQAATPPSSDQCVNSILTPMAAILKAGVGQGTNNRASINVNQDFPENQLRGGCNFEYGQSCTGSAPGVMGTQVNAGYMSWIMQPNLEDNVWGGKRWRSFQA